MRFTREAGWALPFGVLCMLTVGQASALTVSGTINDSNGAAVAGVKVQAWDYDPISPDDPIGSAVYTDATGAYTTGAVAGGWGNEDPDVFIVLYYEMPLTGPLANGKKAYLAYDNDTSPHQLSTESIAGGYFPDTTVNVIINLPLAGTAPGSEIQGIQYLQDDLDYFQSQAVTGWVCPRDLAMDVHTGPGADIGANLWWNNNPYGDAIECQVGLNYIANVSNADRRTIYHEMGHGFQYHAYGEAWPTSDHIGEHHTLSSQWDAGFAITEGWAGYVQRCVADAEGIPGPGIPPQTWRGNSLPNRNKAGYAATGTDNSGEVVEGAVIRIWRGVPQFLDVWDVVIHDNPDSAKEFSQYFHNREGFAAYSALLEDYSKNGIIYCRARIDGFTPDKTTVPIPNDAPATDGHAGLIDDYLFLRGTVIVQKSEVSAGVLNLPAGTATNPAQWVSVLCKEVPDPENSWEDNIFHIPGGPWSVPRESVVFSIDLDWDTTLKADDDYDVAIQAWDMRLYGDQLYPDFDNPRDTNPPKALTVSGVVNNEKWLKYQGTWYSREDHPGSDAWPNDDTNEGRAIIDNTAPSVSNTKP